MMGTTQGSDRQAVKEALSLLGIRDLVLGIQDASFPRNNVLDGGRGSPYSRDGEELFRFIGNLGFTGILFGPQGLTPEHSASPYDGSQFSREILSANLDELADPDSAWGGILRANPIADTGTNPLSGEEIRIDHAIAHRRRRETLRKAFDEFLRRGGDRENGHPLSNDFRTFRRHHSRWLVPDSLYEVLQRKYGASAARLWQGPSPYQLDRELWNKARYEKDPSAIKRRSELTRLHGKELQFYAFSQFVVHRQHHDLLGRSTELGLRFLGDMQIGFSDRDDWRFQRLFLPGYLLGAPPSRTNPDGQPWGYPVLSPEGHAAKNNPSRPGPVQLWLARRLKKLFTEYHGIRVDHPQGLVCPWVYRADATDPGDAVRKGARLFSSPDLRDHPELAPYSIVGRNQINSQAGTARYADDWLQNITEPQRKQYSILFDVMLTAAKKNGRNVDDLIPEILSSCPLPVSRVLKHHGLGRFRVTQKADPENVRDVYRSDSADPEDWIMMGNHDTAPIFHVVEMWKRAGQLASHANYLARRLSPDDSKQASLAGKMVADPRFLAQAQFADLLVGPARHVMVFFTDLFGIKQFYNRPGTISPENWSLRLPATYRTDYFSRVSRGEALDVPAAISLALGARKDLTGGSVDALRSRLASISVADSRRRK